MLGNGNEFTLPELQQGDLIYEHDDTETRTDSFVLSARLQPVESIYGLRRYFDVVNTTVNIDVALLNDNAPQPVTVVTPQSIVQYGRMLWNRNVLEFSDADLDDGSEQLRYTVLAGLEYGHLLDGASGARISAFTQEQLNTNGVLYIHDGSEFSSDFASFTVTDGVHEVNSGVSISVVEMQLDVMHQDVRIAEGGNITLQAMYQSQSALISFSSNLATINTSALVFEVTSQPRNGELEDATGSSPSRLTYAALSSGEVRYQHDHSNTEADQFTFQPVYKEKVFTPFTMDVTVTPIDDTLPVVTGSHRLIVDEGESAVLDTAILMSSDTEVADGRLVYSVTLASPTMVHCCIRMAQQ